MPRVEVFLSHSSKDRRHVEKLAKFLQTKRIRFFYSTRHIRGAQEWHDELGLALERCNTFALILTPDAVKSRWVKHELVFALQAPAYRGRIVPLIFKTCNAKKLSWTLPGFQAIDFRRGFDDGCAHFLAAISATPLRNR